MPRLLKVCTLLTLCVIAAISAVYAAGLEDTVAGIFTRHTIYGVRYEIIIFALILVGVASCYFLQQHHAGGCGRSLSSVLLQVRVC